MRVFRLEAALLCGSRATRDTPYSDFDDMIYASMYSGFIK